jgi:polyisoprenoid-binding protein YceI
MSTIAQQETTLPTGTFVADTVHSNLGFEVQYAVASFTGNVTGFEASLVDGRVEGAAKIESLQTREENLQAHLLSPEFFDAERNPTVSFTGDLVRDGDTATVEGELTMKGITRPVTLRGTITGPAVDHFGATRVGLKLQTTVDRTEFDMKWNMPLPNGEPALSTDVTLKADLTLVAQEA